MTKRVLVIIGIGFLLIFCGAPSCLFIYGLLFNPTAETLPTLVPTVSQNETIEPTPNPTATKRPRPTKTPEPLEMEGDGDSVWDLETSGGVYVVSGWHIGDSNFIVEIYDAATGDLVGIPINCIGDCEDQSVQRLYGGKYLVEVTADGSWYVFWEQ